MGSERAGEPLGQAGPTRRAQGLPRGSTAQPGPERRHRPAAQDADATATGPPPCGSPPSPPASRHRALKGELCAHPLPVTTVGTGTGRCRHRGCTQRELLSQCGVDVAQAPDPCVQRAQGRVPAPPHHPPEDGDRAGTSERDVGNKCRRCTISSRTRRGGARREHSPWASGWPHGRGGPGPGGSTPRGPQGGSGDGVTARLTGGPPRVVGTDHRWRGRRPQGPGAGGCSAVWASVLGVEQDGPGSPPSAT